MSKVLERLRSLLGIVRLRQLVDQIRHRLSFVPGLYVIGAFFVAQATLLIDRELSDETLPQVFTTTAFCRPDAVASSCIAAVS